MENALSRRNFIGGALIAGAGMVGAAALSGCAGKAYAKQDTTGIKWDKEADVVIVGGGAAGLWAAVQAYDNNLSAIVLEKQPEESAGGDVRCCGGYLFPISTDPNVLMGTGSFGEANEDLVYGIDEYGTDAIDWLVAHKYMEWADQPYVVIDGAGPGIYKGLLQAAIDAEAEILYETPGLSLITSDEGEVVGVVAGTKDEPLNVKAHYGVLLATGAYTMNKELMANFHLMGMDYFSVGSPHLTGDGLIMAGELGAKLSKLAKGYEIMYLTSKAASKEIGTGMFCLPPDNGSVMIVNQNGDRFIDEFCSFTHNKSTLPLFDFEGDMMQCRADGAHYVNSSMFEIVDQATFDAFTLGNANAGCSWANCMPEEVGGYIWSADNQAELEKGWIMRGETVADIAEAIGISAEKLQASIDKYNADCAAGVDAFGRNPEKMAPLGDGPYYAIELAPSIIYTIGGLTTDEYGRTLTWRNEPIPRLYSAGNIGNVVTYMQPIAVNGCWGQAGVAISSIAELEPWDFDLE